MIHSHMDYDMQLSLESHVLQKACVGIPISNNHGNQSTCTF